MSETPARSFWAHLATTLLAATASVSLLLPATGCRSAFMHARVQNQTGGVIHLLEVDYPSASFGTEDLANGAAYPYQFKIIGSGTLRVTWTDSAEKEHTSSGPALREGDEGQFTLTLLPDGARWQPSIHQAR